MFKYEIVQQAQALVDSLSSQLAKAQSDLAAALALPEDPVPATPTGLHVSREYWMGVDDRGPLAIELRWDPIETGSTPKLSYIGAPDNPNGPQQWTEIPISFDEVGLPLATLVMQNPHLPQRQEIVFCLQAVRDGQTSEDALRPYAASPYVP